MIGSQLAHYRITAALGAGGMGEVWRATDEKLGRDVALKVLPEAFAQDPDRMARFEREAKVLASLNHPNIAHLYGLESVNTHMAAGTAAPQESQVSPEAVVGHASRVPDTDLEYPSEADARPSSELKTQNSKLPASAGTVTFLVIELVEGEDLSKRIQRGPIPADEAIPIALQIAEALEAAHEAGIVHRDLKPANIMLTEDGTVKVLDFGLAKVLEAGVGDAVSSELPTVTRTQAGAILGTAAYMAPEQARGRTADRRADIWSFGVVLWEMLIGRRLFDGSSGAEVRAAVLTDDIDNGRLPPGVPWSVRELLQRCLHREPRNRLQHMGDARLVLEDVVNGREMVPSGEAPGPRHAAWVPWLVAGMMTVVAGGSLLSILARGPKPQEERGPVQFEVRIPDNGLIVRAEIMTRLAMSPDGRRLAFVASVGGAERLFVRELDSLASVPVEDSEGAYSPFWAPDGRTIGFFSNGRIMRADISGGPPREICSASVQGRAAWGRDGTIVFAELGREHSGLARVDAAGGDPVPVTTLDRASGEVIHLWPQFVPARERILYIRSAFSEERGEMVRDLMVVPIGGGEPKVVMPLDSRFEVVPSGSLLYVREQTLLAQPFDLERIEPSGEPVAIASGLSYMIQTGFAEFGASDNGAVALHGGVSTTELVLLDRQGRDIGLIGDRAAHGVLRLDGSGRLLAVEVYDPKLGSRDIWIHDLELGTARRLTLGSSDDTDPMWWPDGQQVVFASDMAGAPDIYKVSLMGGGEAEPIVSAPPPLEPKDVFVSPVRVMYMMWSRATNADLWVADPGVPGSSEPYLKTVHNESDARVSPDDRWVVFTSDETGSYEVYVARTGDASTRRRVSVSGGWSPIWRGDGRELYFLGPGGAMVALFDPDNGTLKGPPKLLFAIDDPVWRGAWDVAPDGTTFVINRTVVDRRRDPIRVILDWPGLISHSISQGGTS